MSDEDGEQLLSEAEQVSLSSLAHDLGSLFAARSSNGDVVFNFPAEDGVEERAHRCAAGLPRRGSRASRRAAPRFLLPLTQPPAAHLPAG